MGVVVDVTKYVDKSLGVTPRFSPLMVIFVPAVASFGEIPVTSGGGPGGGPI